MSDAYLSTDEIDRTVEIENPEVAPDGIIEAVREAFEASIGHLVTGRSVVFLSPEHDRHVARFDFNYMEIPACVVSDDAGPGDWLPPYRTRELVEAELRERLPDGISYEAKTNTQTVLYEEVSAR